MLFFFGTLLESSGPILPWIKDVEDMKYVIAIIKPSKLENIHSALVEAGVSGLTTSEVSGFGRQKGHTEIYRGAEYNVKYVPKIKIEVAISDEHVEAVVDCIKQTAGTEKIGDGKIFVLELSQAIRIRTGETGEEAL